MTVLGIIVIIIGIIFGGSLMKGAEEKKQYVAAKGVTSVGLGAFIGLLIISFGIFLMTL